MVYNYDIPERFIDKQYKEKIDKHIFKKVESWESRLKEGDVEYNDNKKQDMINLLINNHLFFITNKRSNDKLYKGTLIKNSCETFKEFKDYYYTTPGKVLDGEIFDTSNIIDIYDNYDDVPDKLKNIVIEPVKSVVAELEIDEAKPIDNSGDLVEFKKIIDLLFKLYTKDKEYLKRQITQINRDMCMEELINNKFDDPVNIKSCISLFLRCRSEYQNPKKKGRDTHEVSIMKACKTYGVDEKVLQSLIGSRGGYTKKI